MKKILFFILLFISVLNIPLSSQVTPDLYDINSIHEIRLTIDQPNWMAQMDSMRIYGDGMLVASASIDGVKYENIGVGYRGSTSYQSANKRNPLQIKLNYINKKQNHQGYKNLKLSSALRDPSMIREVLGYEIARQYMPAPRANFTTVYINNEYRGLYIDIEAISDGFLEKNFGTSDGALLKCNPDLKKDAPQGCKNKIFGTLEYEKNANCYLQNWDLQSDSGWDDLIELTRMLNEDTDNVGKVLNVDRTLWMLAFNNVVANLSSYSGQYSHNYYLYKDDNGQFNPILWDMNLCFGSFKNTGVGSDLDLKALQELDPLLHADNITKPLISKLLQNPDNKRTYLSHLRTILYDNFDNDAYEKRARELQKMIQMQFSSDPYKFYSLDEFNRSLTNTIGEKSKIPGITELMEKRAKFLKKHPDLSAIPPIISEINVANRAQYSNVTLKDFRITAKVDKFPKKVKVMYRYPGEKTWRETYMQDDGKTGDGEVGDKMFGVIIPTDGKSEIIEYYLIAENPGAISYDPPNYMFKWYSANLTELNK